MALEAIVAAVRLRKSRREIVVIACRENNVAEMSATGNQFCLTRTVGVELLLVDENKAGSSSAKSSPLPDARPLYSPTMNL
jgi:hypothetical protein